MEKEKDSLWWKFNDACWAFYDRVERYIKYNVIGTVGAAIHFTILWLLVDIAGMWYIPSAIIAITLAGINNYTLNYYWTFRKRKSSISHPLKGVGKFLLSIAITEPIYLGILYICVDIVGLHYMVGAFVALSLTTFLRYIIAEKWIWKK